MRFPWSPVQVVTDPRGESWEIYISRTVDPEWKQVGDGEGFISSGGGSMGGPIGMLIDLAGIIVGSIILPLLRFVFLYPFAFVKGRRSHAAQVLAISFSSLPGMTETRAWTTTSDQARSVAETIAIGIQDGKVVQPVGAVYAGSRQT